MLAGNVVAICFSGLVCVTLSLIKPQNYDWALMKEIPMIESDENAFLSQVGFTKTRQVWHPGAQGSRHRVYLGALSQGVVGTVAWKAGSVQSCRA